MSSTRKKAESIPSRMMILVDFERAMITDNVSQKALPKILRNSKGDRVTSRRLVPYGLSVSGICCSVRGALNPYYIIKVEACG